jgi:hypothetical protein
MLAVEGVEPVASPVHHLLDDGSFAITVPGEGLLSGMIVAAGSSGAQAVLEMTAACTTCPPPKWPGCLT